jgi:hypothetical protein
MRVAWLFIAVVICMAIRTGSAQDIAPVASSQLDSDHDGLSDQVEQALLDQFAPSFMIARHDCSNVPAEFSPNLRSPAVFQENGTIYGQAFPSRLSTPAHPIAELHFYHLWRTDCGPHGHHLDTEHVAVLVRASDTDSPSAKWRAEYWYAAAHENTVCDVSQITRASTLHAEDHGAKVWISPGKHASYLNEALCNRGCGADRCMDMIALQTSKVVNLGEMGEPMNGSTFISSKEWPLAAKMQNSNFPEEPVARLEMLPESDIAWFNAGRHPTQQVISVSSSTEQALATSGQDTTTAVSTAGGNTDVAISVAGASTGNGLRKTYVHTRDALGKSAKAVGQALHIIPRANEPE